MNADPDRKVIRIEMAQRQTEPSVIEQMYEERDALLMELRDAKCMIAILLKIHGATVIPTSVIVHLDPEHTDIISEMTPDGRRYSLEEWGQKR